MAALAKPATTPTKGKEIIMKTSGYHQVSGLSFLTPVNILIKNYCMENTTTHYWPIASIMIDGFVKSPISVLILILRHCGVLAVRLIPQASLALILTRRKPVLYHPDFDFLRVCHD
jgi:hypothetical protein